MLVTLKLKSAIAIAALAGPLAGAAVAPIDTPGDHLAVIVARPFDYRPAGEFSTDIRPVHAPLRTLQLDRPLRIMKRHVTAGEYELCVQEAACPRLPLSDGRKDVAMVGVSWHDASAYATWISRKTGKHHRLPTDEEWTFAAAEKARDEALPLMDPEDPAKAWLARYETEATRDKFLAAPQPIGTYGENTYGLADLAANIWEWTNTCFERATLKSGKPHVTNTNCGVRVVQGAHRAYMTDFIRDPRTGGCAVGVPPANLGFRLVVEPGRKT